MAHAFGPAALGALLLAGCAPAVDDPSNTPLRGRWQRETKLTALIANDVWIDRKDVPFPLPKDETIVKACIEPKLRSADEINSDMLRESTNNCSFGPISRNGNTITSEGKCAPAEKFGLTISGTMELEAHEAADRADGRVSATLFLKKQSGATERVRVGAQVKWTRLGDCGK